MHKALRPKKSCKAEAPKSSFTLVEDGDTAFQESLHGGELLILQSQVCETIQRLCTLVRHFRTDHFRFPITEPGRFLQQSSIKNTLIINSELVQFA